MFHPSPLDLLVTWSPNKDSYIIQKNLKKSSKILRFYLYTAWLNFLWRQMETRMSIWGVGVSAQRYPKQKGILSDVLLFWCGHGDSNPNAGKHENLNLACLPIPSCPHIQFPSIFTRGGDARGGASCLIRVYKNRSVTCFY